MVDKCAASKCTSGHASNEKKQIAKINFPLQNAEFNKHWIRFLNKKENHLCYQHSKLLAVFPEKDPSQMNCQHFNNVI